MGGLLSTDHEKKFDKTWIESLNFSTLKLTLGDNGEIFASTYDKYGGNLEISQRDIELLVKTHGIDCVEFQGGIYFLVKIDHNSDAFLKKEGCLPDFNSIWCYLDFFGMTLKTKIFSMCEYTKVFKNLCLEVSHEVYLKSPFLLYNMRNVCIKTKCMYIDIPNLSIGTLERFFKNNNSIVCDIIIFENAFGDFYNIPSEFCGSSKINIKKLIELTTASTVYIGGKSWSCDEAVYNKFGFVGKTDENPNKNILNGHDDYLRAFGKIYYLN